MNLVTCILCDKLLRLGHKMIAWLGNEIGLLQAKAAAKLTGTFRGMVQAFWTSWHFSTYRAVSMPTAWGHLLSAHQQPRPQLNGASAKMTGDMRAL